MEDKIVQNFLTIINQIKMFHWETTNYATHKALDELHGDLSDLVDSFVEILIGKYGRDGVLNPCVINVRVIGQMDIESVLDQSIGFLIELGQNLNSNTDTDLLNIKDEMLSLINKTKYLLTLQ
jgi:hypothetical protein